MRHIPLSRKLILTRALLCAYSTRCLSYVQVQRLRARIALAI